MWGDQVEILDGTQLAADWTFSGLQKFGQGMLDRLRGLRLPNPLLEKVMCLNIFEGHKKNMSSFAELPHLKC
jgi:hypothetical protein